MELDSHFNIIDRQLRLLVEEGHAHPVWVKLADARDAMGLLRNECERKKFVPKNHYKE